MIAAFPSRLRQRLGRVLVVLMLALSSAQAVAQVDDIATLNQQSVAAFNAGDVAGARVLVNQVLAANPAVHDAAPLAYLEAINNMIFLREQADTTDPEIDGLVQAGLDFAMRHDVAGSGQLYTLRWTQALRLHQRGRSQQAGRAAAAVLRDFRGTELHGLAATQATDLFFELGDYRAMVNAMREMTSVTGAFYAKTDIEALYERQITLEAKADVEAVRHIIDARIHIAELVAPQLAPTVAQQGHWTVFHMNYVAENFGPAARALRLWAETGDLEPDHQAFIDDQARDALQLAQLSGFGDRSDVALGYATLVVAFNELATDGGDLQLAAALRELGYAQTAIGQHAAARTSLQDGLALLDRTPAGLELRYLLLEDLAANAWQRQDIEQAQALYVQAEQGYQATLASGGQQLAPFDLAVLALNRARLSADLGDFETSQLQLTEANRHYATAEQGPLKQNQQRLQVRLLEHAAQLASLQGRLQDANARAVEAVEIAKTVFPPNHPDLALVLTNAADTLFVGAQLEQAAMVLGQARDIAHVALPPDAALFNDIRLKQALFALSVGDRAAALEDLRAVASAQKSQRFRAQLAQGGAAFELLAWLLLTGPNADQPEIIDEALSSLQWTQVSGSAEALAMLQTRIAASDPTQAILIRAQQDLSRQDLDLRNALNAALADGEAADAAQRALRKRLAQVGEMMTLADGDLTAAGLDHIGIAPVRALRLTEIQNRLEPGEVLVSFVLPSLAPDRVLGLDGSSNLALAITADDFVVAPIIEESRGALRTKVAAFRCAVAVSEPRCGVRTWPATRGAMTDDESDAEPLGFETEVAHALYRDLFSGVESLLDRSDHVIVAPPGDLLGLPFSALVVDKGDTQDPTSVRWLVSDHAVSVLPSISALDLLRGRALQDRGAERHQFLGVGDPVIGNAPDMACDQISVAATRSGAGLHVAAYAADLHEGLRLAEPATLAALPRLPDATCELRQMAKTFPSGATRLLLREDANETDLKALSEAGVLEGYPVISFATHGLTAGETSAITPGLVLSPPERASALDDGLLTAAEIATLRLDADLVILSACNTAAAGRDGEEGLSGIARGFFHAGARGVMVTHWSVYSEAAVDVSTALVQQRNAGMTSAFALRAAVMDILDDPQVPAYKKHPSYWAAFAMIGL